MLRRVAPIALLVACSFSHGATPPGDDAQPPIDGAPDVGIDGLLCFGGGNSAICLPAPPPPEGLMLMGMLDTGGMGPCSATQPAWQTPGQPAVCFVVASTITIPMMGLAAHGDRPLVLLATDSIQIDGLIEGGSRAADNFPMGTGPGADPVNCTGLGTGGDRDSGGGGGAGGSFMTDGGDGGSGDSGGAQAASASSATPPTPTALRGGCPGSNGGDGHDNNSHGVRGHGGGAVMVIAGNAITFTGMGALDASGAAASGGGHFSGGGGAGSGGMIVLFAPTISAQAQTAIVANGGGGASGGTGNNGLDGSEVDLTAPLTPARGGIGPGGNGGSGYPGVSVNGIDGTSSQGGGGGGGGAGYILSNVSPSPAVVTPAVAIGM